MSEFLVFAVTGLAAGAVYALAGIGLVLTYKTSGVFNLGHGALATVSAYLFFTLLISHGWPWPVAALVAVVGAGVALGLLLEPLARRLRQAPLTTQIASTVGLLLVVEAAVILLYGQTEERDVPVFVAPGGTTIFGAPVRDFYIATFGVAIVATVALSLWLRFTRLGIAMRGVVQDDELLALGGTDPILVRRIAWVVGATLAAASGVLFAPLLPLDPVQLTLIVVAAFGAAALGQFTSLPITCAGGLVIGVGASLCTGYITSTALAGLSSSLPFIVLFLVIVFTPRRRAAGYEPAAANVGRSYSAPAPAQLGLAIIVFAALAFVPVFAGIHLTAWTTGVATIAIFLSLSLLVRTSGQVSLCHIAFSAIGGTTLVHLTAGEHWPWFAAFVAVGIVALPIGALLAIPAIRQSGLYLALATFGFGLLVQYLFYPQRYMFGASGSGLVVPRPTLFGSRALDDTAFYYLVLALVVLATIVVVALTRSRLGRLLRGVASAPRSLETTGAAVNLTRILVFCISASLAAMAGALIASANGTISIDSYSPLQSLLYFALIVIVIGREPWNALIAALPLIVLPSYIQSYNTSVVLQLIFGATALLLVFVPGSSTGMPVAMAKRLDDLFRRPATTSVPAREAASNGAAEEARQRRVEREGGLAVDDLQVRFGGVVAVKQVTLLAPTGQVTGLIGPNGAGKTTLFNACSGFVRPAGGAIRLNGTDVLGNSPAARSRIGLGRTLQHMELFDSLSVWENVALGREGQFAGANPFSHLFSRRREARDISRAAAEALELCSLTELAHLQVGSLSTGQRRLVDLARCLAGSFEMLLLDEPSSGLDQTESDRLGQVIERVVAERGVGVLLVEHDLSLVMALSATVYVVDFGELIFSGTPAEATASPLVQAVYLGSAEANTATPRPGVTQ